MKKTALFKTSLREIKNSPARFLSILLIIFLGVAFFVGIGATGPDMLKSGDDYYQKHQLADAAVTSTLGLSKTDLDLIKEDPKVQQAQAQYTLDLNLTAKNKTIRFIGYSQKSKLNQAVIVKGRLPKKSGEIALDNRAALLKNYQVGDTFTIAKDDDPLQQVKVRKFKVVGFVNSPEYIENVQRGNTNVGSGSIDYFALILPKDLNLTVYSRILVTFREAQKEAAYSDAYDKAVDEGMINLKQRLKKRPELRLAEVKQAADQQLDEVRKQIAGGKGELNQGEAALQAAQEKIDSSKKALADAKAQTADELTAAQGQIDAAQAEIAQQETELAEKAHQLAQEETELNNEQKPADVTEEAATAELNQQLTQQEKSQSAAKELVTALKAASTDPEKLKEQQTAWQKLAETADDPALAKEIAELDPTGEDLSVALEKLVVAAETSQAEQVKKITATKTEIDTVKKNNAEENKKRAEEYAKQVEEAKIQLAEEQEQLTAAQTALAEQKAALTTQQTQLAERQVVSEQGFAETAEKIAQAEKDYQTGLADYQNQTSENMPKLLDLELRLRNEQQRLSKLKPADYLFLDRDENPGYTEYQQNAQRISSLATVFPIIFFLIAALVSLTTMTRMIEEKRSEIGTFKALGYKNHEIAQKFLIYSLSAGLMGALLGLALGFYLFPSIIINAYGQLYNLDHYVTPWYWSYSLIAIVVALVCTVVVALLTLRIDLFSSPASLLRPKAPKAGKRVWLESIKPLWKRLSFNQKVTMRNLFRYKARMLMTIIGIAGCTGMILTGFGLRDSIADIVPIQFEKIMHYQGVVTFNEQATPTQTAEYQKAVKKLNRFAESLPIASQNFTLSDKDHSPQDVSVYVPADAKKLPDFVLLNDRETGQKYRLTDQGAIINEKLADLFELSVGDTIQLKASDKQSYPVKISAIAENYTGHFAYLSPTYYQKVFGEKPAYNAEFLQFDKQLSKKQEKAIAAELMELNKVVNVSFLSDSLDVLDETTGTLNIVVWVLIISAGLLALIVLYNLNNINISERIRELSTIKVLGFYNNELTMYIFRENIILTLIGIALGLFLGKIEHDYVLGTVEVDMLMFSPQIHLASYAYASLITIFFTIIVGILVYFKLKKVDMIAALKSNE